jgi:hypothetical protein
MCHCLKHEIYMITVHTSEETLHPHYKDQPVNALYSENCSQQMITTVL